MSDAVDRVWRRVLLLVGRGRIAAVDDGDNVQKLQVQLGADEIVDGMPRLAQYGFQSVPPPGSDAVALFVAGERSNGVVIACGSQEWRMRGLASGEVALSDDKGQCVYLSVDGIRIDGGGRTVAIVNAPDVTMSGNLHVAGNMIAGGTVADQSGATTMAGMRSTYNGHTHGASPLPTPTM
jgi:phage baseplate assembly protein V